MAPPWWQTASFRLALLLLILIVAALVFRAWRHRLLLEHRLRLERAQAEWSETLAAEKTEFVATLSHELRNQLQGLGASVALLRLRSSELPTVLTRVETAVGAMAGLLNDALELSRLEGGRLPLRPEPLRLEALSRELDEALIAAAASRPDLVCRWQAEVHPLIVTLDRLRFRQIVLNLAGNALRHARSEVEVGLRAVHEPAAGAARLHLSVSDDGPGIPAELKPRLFRRWQRGDGQGPEGSGLGLAICRQLAEAMAGTIAVDSAPGRTVFTVELSVPASVEVDETSPDGEWLLLDGAEALPMPEGLPLRRCASPLVLLTTLDTRTPLAVLVAPTQATALQPLLPLLRQRHPRLRVLLLATAAMPADRARALEQGYDGLLGLPLTTAALAAVLRDPGL
jgi:signal transduction histidine kinase/CheY-like chemotaxis protein